MWWEIFFQKHKNKFKLLFGSSISEIDQHANIVDWLNTQCVPALYKNDNKVYYCQINELNIELPSEYTSCDGLIFMPIILNNIEQWQLIFWLDTTPPKQLISMLPLIQSAVSHAWQKLQNDKRWPTRRFISRKIYLKALGIVLLTYVLIKFV